MKLIQLQNTFHYYKESIKHDYNVFVDLGFCEREATELKAESDKIIKDKINNITVMVCGSAGMGKSTISCLIGQFLKRKGFDVDIQLLDGMDPDEFEVGIVQKTCAMQDKDVSITIKETQLRRDSQFEVIG
jgi:septin family protein